MCLLLFYINPHPQAGQYRLVLVSNRDEFYTRPTKPAHFWDSGILAGMDAMPEREGGTWLGVVQDGRIGCLLNLLEPVDESKAEGESRGYLVVNYLKSKQGGREYIDKISHSGTHYSSFILLTLDPAGDTYKVTMYNHLQNQIQQLGPGIHGIGNSPYDKPFLKVEKGRKKLEKLIEAHGQVEQEEELIEALQAMMKDAEANYPDPQLIKRGSNRSEVLLRSLSSIWVACHQHNYGSRTTTVILVDQTGRMVVRERTMREPVDLDKIEWDANNFSFQMV